MADDPNVLQLVNASSNRDLEAVKALISSKLDLNATVGSNGWNALHAAIEMEDESIIRYLLGAGADPNALAKGLRPLHHAIEIESADGDDPDAEPVFTEILLHAGADPRLKAKGMTALEYAQELGHEAAVALMSENGAPD